MKLLSTTLTILLLATPALAQSASEALPPQPQASSMGELLNKVKQGWNIERAENQRRERDFKQRQADQQQLLDEAIATMNREEARSEALENQYQENEISLTQLETQLKERMGNLGELFGVVRQVAGDTRSNIESSIVSAQLPGRSAFLEELGKSKALPAISDLEKLWYMLHEEATASGEIVTFPATVVSAEGGETTTQVTRVGSFNAVSGGKYLNWDLATQKLKELGRQPPAKYLATVAPYESATDQIGTLAIDPSRGVLLGLFVEKIGTFSGERLEQGGVIGQILIYLGAATCLFSVIRFGMVFVGARRVGAQRKSKKLGKNALGRVLKVYEENQTADAETLELKLDEAILRESSKLDRGLWLIKVVSVVAPLMGLLGTVTGMIETFQSITLFGTGDPKLMAGGISEALVTTMLGLCVAIPVTLLHALVASQVKGVVDILEEQSAGLVATRAEEAGTVA